MVLCVSRICSVEEFDCDDGVPPKLSHTPPDENGEPMLPKLVVEMTDGWYRVRVEADDVIIRAIRRGALRVGMKVGVVGAKVWTLLFGARFDPIS